MQVLVLSETGRGSAHDLALASIRAHHPEATVVVVVTHPAAASGDGPTMAITARDLSIGGLPYTQAWLAGGPAFARWAVVPAAVEALGPIEEALLVLPDHAWVRARLDDLAAATADHGVALVARGGEAESGIVHGGWIPEIAVFGTDPNRRSAVLRWWGEIAVRSLFDLRDDLLDVDDPWRGFVDSGGPVTAITDPSVRVSPQSAYLLDGVDAASTRLATFPAFDADRPWWYSESADEIPLLLTSSDDGLRRICLDYASSVRDYASGEAATEGQLFGVPWSRELRDLLRSRLTELRESGQWLPDLFDPDSARAFIRWLTDPTASTVTGVSPMADVVWRQRPDLAAAFPNVRWADRDGFVRWLWTHALTEGLVTTGVLPPRPGAARATSVRLPPDPRPAPPVVTVGDEAPPVRRPYGVNLAGYHDAELGLGVAVRRVGAALDAARIPWAKVTYDRSHSRRRGAAENSADAPYWFNLVLVAPDQLQFFADDVGPALFDGRYTIGLWFWETDTLRQRQLDAFELVDEVWASTRYLTDVFRAHSTRTPVTHVPVPLEFAPATRDATSRLRLGLDDRFTFLFSFDFLSIAARKNPLGLVKAYCRAFAPDEGTRLILKSINGGRHLAEAEEIRVAIAERDDIEMWDRYLDASDRIDLVANVDAYVSLHRSEGLGLTMAEAMSAGTPVIATGYSGNLDFMSNKSALLVDHTVIPIGEGSFYPPEGHWADPDLDHAAELMRRLHDDAAGGGRLRSALSEAGERALEPFTVKRVGAAIDARLRELWR